MLRYIKSLILKRKSREIKNTLKGIGTSFLGTPITTFTCIKCKKNYCTGVLDYKEDNLICPRCSDRKD